MSQHDLMNWEPDKDRNQDLGQDKGALDTPTRQAFSQSLKAVHSQQVHRNHVKKLFARYLHHEPHNN